MLLCAELAPKFSLVVRDCMGWDLASLFKTHFLMCLRFSFMTAEINGQLQLRPGTGRFWRAGRWMRSPAWSLDGVL